MGPRSPLRLEAINGIRGRTTPIIPAFSPLSGHETLPRTPLFTFHVPLLACDGWVSNCSNFFAIYQAWKELYLDQDTMNYILESVKHTVWGVQHMALNMSVNSVELSTLRRLTEVSPLQSTGGRISEWPGFHNSCPAMFLYLYRCTFCMFIWICGQMPVF